MKKLNFVWLFSGLLAGSLLLAACGDVDTNSTKVSSTVRDNTAIANAQSNTSRGPVQTDPTKSTVLAGGGTATPIPTPAPGLTPAAKPTTAAGSAATAKPSTGDPASGEKLLTSLGCAGCHAQGGKVAGVGPKLANTTRDEDYIRNIIRKGKAPMPVYTTAQVSDAQLEDLVAYIKNLK